MNKLDKFRGIVEINVSGDRLIIVNLTVNDIFDFLILKNKEENQFEYGIKLISRILKGSFPNECEYDIEQYVISNYGELIQEMVKALGWSQKSTLKKKDKHLTGLAALKARASMEFETEGVEDKYITTCYVLMREFKYTQEEILNMKATTFLILIEEMNKQSQKEKEEMEKSRRKR
jgi:hypothetical protein